MRNRDIIPGLFWTVLLVLASGNLTSSLAGGPDTEYVLNDVRSLLKKKDGLPLDVRAKAEMLASYYGKPDARLLWQVPERANELTSALTRLTSSRLTNLEAGLARLETRKQALRSEDTSLLALVEITFSAQLIRAAENLRLGQINLYRDMLHQRTLERFIYADHILDMVAAGGSLAEIMPKLEPQYVDYQAIRAKLLEYVSIEQRGGWPALRAGPDLKEGASGPRVADLRQRLDITGYRSLSAGPADVFDAGLAEAVRQFQRHYNMVPSGVLDRRTLLALNIPVRDRIAQLSANLERWRWFEDFPPGDLWLINSNAAWLELRQSDGKRGRYSLKVDGGCEHRPAFDTEVDRVEFAPEFTVPKSVAARYILPVLQTKPAELDPTFVIYADSAAAGARSVDWKSYSEANFPFSIRQAPGSTNILGIFNILLRDDSDVSIHGHPVQEPKLPIPRNLWPACVAVLGSADMAAQVLAATGVPSLTNAADPKGQTRRIEPPRPIHVVFLYATIWLDADGDVVFGPDPLGLDTDLARKLSANANS